MMASLDEDDRKEVVFGLDAVPLDSDLGDDNEVTVKEVKVRQSAWFTKGQIVAVAECDEGSKTTRVRVKVKVEGTVLEMRMKKGDRLRKGAVLFTMSSKCAHSTLMKDMCADCGLDLKEIQEKDEGNVSMVHSIPELKVSSKEAMSLGREDEERLIRHKKLVLLVDLDQTLIHTTNENIPANIKGVTHFQLYGPRSPWYHTRIRPFTAEFLASIADLFELHIVTFGARMYAHNVASFIDPDGKYFSHRILSRDECFDSRTKTANLSSLFPCGDHMVCIIDDREDVWKFAPNLVHVKPYNFFKNTGDINAPPGLPDNKQEAAAEKMDEGPKGLKDLEGEEKDLDLSDEDNSSSAEDVADRGKKEEDKDDEGEKKMNEESEDDLKEMEDTDDYLKYLQDILTTIHTAYYDLLEQFKEEKTEKKPDLKSVIPYVKRKTLQGTNVLFSGVVPNHVPLKKSRAYLVARSLGANVQEKVVVTAEGEGKTNTTHLIAARLGTAKVNEVKALNKKGRKIHVVTPDWLWGCAERWDRIDELLFPLTPGHNPVTLKPPAHCSSPEIAFAERCANVDVTKTPPRLAESSNPALKLSADDWKKMDDEIDEEISSESSGDEKEKKFPVKPPTSSSSSEDSLEAEEPKGWGKDRKRKRLDDEDDDEEEEEDDDDDDDDLVNMAEELEKEFGQDFDEDDVDFENNFGE